MPGSLDGDSILASLLVSSIGVVVFLYGKRQKRVPHILIGLVLTVYTYFVSSVLLMFAIAAVLLGVLWVTVKKLGW